jgi:hypothetical protein
MQNSSSSYRVSKVESSCKNNPNGSYNIRLTLYFKPQSYFYLGLIVSGVTLAGCLGYLGWIGVRNFRIKRLKLSKNVQRV